MVEFDSETLFDVSAAVVATVAVVLFVFNVDFAYSPASKVALVVAFLAGVFAVTQRTADYRLVVLGYGVVVVGGVAVFFDAVNTFDVGNSATVFGLLCIAGLLFLLRTRLDEENRFVSGTAARNGFAVVAVLAVALLVVDVGTGGPAYELRSADRAEVSDSGHDARRIGAVVVSNPTPLPERVETPDYRACTAGNWSAFARPADPDGRRRPVRANLDVQDRYDDHVLGFSSKTYPVDLYLDGANLTGRTFPVRTTSECPDEETGEPYVAVFEAAEDRPYEYPLTAS